MLTPNEQLAIADFDAVIAMKDAPQYLIEQATEEKAKILQRNEQRIQDLETNFGTVTEEYEEGYKAGYQACREETARILKEHGYEYPTARIND